MCKSIRYLIALVVFSFMYLTLKAQVNLVPNPSFESDSCYYGQGVTPNPWFAPPPLDSTVAAQGGGGGSPDTYNTCAPPYSGIGPNTSYNVFANGTGHQIARTGNCYVGIGGLCFVIHDTINWPGCDSLYCREYIECKLIQPLHGGYTYCAGYYVSLSDTSNDGISSMGLLFTKNIAAYDTCYQEFINGNPNNFIYMSTGLIPYMAQIQNDSNRILSDKVHWIKISGKYTAKGGEQYITIGNFSSPNQTRRHTLQVSNYNSNTKSYYYYIDDVFVYECGTYTPQDTFALFVPNVFTPNKDGTNDLFTVKASAVSYLNLKIYNRWGSLLYKQTLQPQDTAKTAVSLSWSGSTAAGTACSAGTYYYVLTYTRSKGKESGVKKGSFTLLR